MVFPSVLSAIAAHAQTHPSKLCLADINKDITYEEYAKLICGTRQSLKSSGIGEGDRVIAKATQTIDFLVLCHAVQLNGSLFMPLEATANAGRIEQIAAFVSASFFVGDEVLDGIPCAPLASLIAVAEENTMAALLPEDSSRESMVLFTTGTTGTSKGIVLTYASEVAVAENVLYGVEMKENNVEIVSTPLNHSFSIRRYFANMLRGGAVVLLDGVIFLKRFFEMLDRYPVTALSLVPASLSVIYRLSGDRIGQYNAQLDYVQLGSAPIPETDKERLLRLLPDCRLYNIYGATEAGCACCLNFNSEDNRPFCIGYPTKHAEFIVVDEDRRKIASSKENTGLIAYTGAMMMKGYYHEPALTGETVVDGYIYTKDIGYIDEKGRVYMLGRDDDVINTGGNKVSPGEVEEVARRFPGVRDCICGPETDAILGNVPVLYVVEDAPIDRKELLAHLSEHVESYKLPKRIALIDEVPRTYNGKVWRAKFSEIRPIG